MESVSDKVGGFLLFCFGFFLFCFFYRRNGSTIQEELEGWEDYCNVSTEKFNSPKCHMMSLG